MASSSTTSADAGRVERTGGILESGSLQVRLLGCFAVGVSDRLVPEGAWRLRRAKSLVKLLALAPERRTASRQVAERCGPTGRTPPRATCSRCSYHRPSRARRRRGHAAARLALRDDVLGPGESRGSRSTSTCSRQPPQQRRSGDELRSATGRSTSTRASCCRRTATRAGRPRGASPCGSATSALLVRVAELQATTRPRRSRRSSERWSRTRCTRPRIGR